MKTLADFKRKIKVGVNLHCIYHQAFAGRDGGGKYLFKDEDKGIRPISISKSTQFACKTIRTDGKEIDVWMDFPKASKCKVIDKDTITIYQEDFRVNENPPLIPLLTYKFV